MPDLRASLMTYFCVWKAVTICKTVQNLPSGNIFWKIATSSIDIVHLARFASKGTFFKTVQAYIEFLAIFFMGKLRVNNGLTLTIDFLDSIGGAFEITIFLVWTDEKYVKFLLNWKLLFFTYSLEPCNRYVQQNRATHSYQILHGSADQQRKGPRQLHHRYSCSKCCKQIRRDGQRSRSCGDICHCLLVPLHEDGKK